MPRRAPAGTHHHPPLPVTELDERAWAAVSWRQEHLPLHQLRRERDWASLWHLEWAAAWHAASRLGLDDDQRYSLARRHVEHVEALVALATPGLVPPRSRPHADRDTVRAISMRRGHRCRRGLHFTVGWGIWFANRQAGMRKRWFRLRTLPAYRGAPRLVP